MIPIDFGVSSSKVIRRAYNAPTRGALVILVVNMNTLLTLTAVGASVARRTQTRELVHLIHARGTILTRAR